MRRAVVTSASAALGAAGVVLLTPHPGTPAGAATAVTSTPDATSGSGEASDGSGAGSSSASGSSGSTDSSGSSASPGSAASGTVDGTVVRDRWGPVQVRISVDQGTITDITMLQLPSDGRSRWINDQAVPVLVSQALQAQSAHIDGVSGATDTTQAFVASLSSALREAGL